MLANKKYWVITFFGTGSETAGGAGCLAPVAFRAPRAGRLELVLEQVISQPMFQAPFPRAETKMATGSQSMHAC